MKYDGQEPHIANISQLAAMFKRGRSTIREQVSKAGIKPVKTVKKTNFFDISEVAVLLFGNESTGGTTAEDIDRMKPADRKYFYDAENKKLDLMIRARELVPTSEVRKTFKELQSSMKEKIQSYPDVLERDEGISPSEVERMIRLCDGLQVVLHEAWDE